MLAGKDGSHEELEKFLADMASVMGTSLETPDTTEDKKGDDPMWAADSSLPEEWLFSEE